MNETETTTPVTQFDETTYHELENEAKTPEDVITLREMASADLAKTAEATLNEAGNQSTSQTFDVTSLGSDTLAARNEAIVENAKESLAVNSETWHTEEK